MKAIDRALSTVADEMLGTPRSRPNVRLVKANSPAPQPAPVKLTDSQLEQSMRRVVLEIRQDREARIAQDVANFRKL